MDINNNVARKLLKAFNNNTKAAAFSYIMFITEVGYEFKPKIAESLYYSLDTINKRIKEYPNGAVARWVNKGGDKNELVNNPVKLANVMYNDNYRPKGYKLGNTEPNDGWKYRGRGLIQLTGKDLYKYMSKKFNHDFVNNPDDINSEEYNVDTSIEYMFLNKRTFEDRANKDDLKGMRRCVNGGTTGLPRFKELVDKHFHEVIQAMENIKNMVLSEDIGQSESITVLHSIYNTEGGSQ